MIKCVPQRQGRFEDWNFQKERKRQLCRKSIPQAVQILRHPLILNHSAYEDLTLNFCHETRLALANSMPLILHEVCTSDTTGRRKWGAVHILKLAYRTLALQRRLRTFPAAFHSRSACSFSQPRSVTPSEKEEDLVDRDITDFLKFKTYSQLQNTQVKVSRRNSLRDTHLISMVKRQNQTMSRRRARAKNPP